MGYRGDGDVPFLKFTLTNPKNVPTVRDKSSLVVHPSHRLTFLPFHAYLSKASVISKTSSMDRSQPSRVISSSSFDS